jgi:hypothetical protein
MSDPAVTITADPTTGTVVADAAPVLHAPGAPTTDFLWRAVVMTCCYLIAVAGTALVLGMFLNWRGFVAVELVQGVFLVVFGFVAGLLAPSPSRR